MVENYSLSRVLRSSAGLALIFLIAASVHVHPIASAQDTPHSSNQPSASNIDTVSTAGLHIARVPDSDESAIAIRPGSSYSSFNLDSTRFILRRSGRSALYSFNQAELAASFEGNLFEGRELDDSYWSSNSPDVVFALRQGEKSGQAQIYTVDVTDGAQTLVKDFSGVLPSGSLGGFSKARINDDHFSFAWRESEISAWRYLVVWDR